MKQWYIFLALGATLGLPSHLQAQEACPNPTAVRGDLLGPLADVRFLADDALQGRAAGSPGERCAAGYLADRFRQIGLEGAGPNGSYFQLFPVRTGSGLGSDNRLRISGRNVEQGKEWAPYGFSSSGSSEAQLVYVGAGVAAPGAPESVDQVGRIDVDGAIAVVELDTPGATGLYDDAHFKASTLAGRGAAAVLVLLPEGADLPDPAGEVRPSAGIPVGALVGETAEVFRLMARRGDVATLRTDVGPVFADARNVAAVIPGSDPDAGVVVVGAHYDHLGLGGEGSLAPNTRAVHNGADDNASGTAAMLRVAESIVGTGPLDRTVVFLAFSAEEMGLLGSAYYVSNPSYPTAETVAMINLDMVGRLRDNTVTVFGVATADEWEEVLTQVNAALDEPLQVALQPDGFGPSDHSSFYGEGIPVLHFFTNTHSEYHRPDDDWQTVNGEGIERVASLVTGVTRELAGATAAPLELTVVESPEEPHGGASLQSSSSSGGYGPYLGTIPDMSTSESGLRITGVSEGSPAELAGLRGGDVIVEFAGRDITDIYAYTYALRDHSPGDTVAIVVVRNGERVEVEATLGERR